MVSNYEALSLGWNEVFRSLVLLLAVAAGALPAGASVRIADINMVPLVTSSSPREFVTAGNQVFFVATTPAAGVGLWKTDGTEGGTILLHGFGGIREQRFWLTALGDGVLFAADDVVTGDELWRSDGTAAGTMQVRDIQTGVIGSNPHDLVAMNGRVFSADTAPAAPAGRAAPGGRASCATSVSTARVVPSGLTVVDGVLFRRRGCHAWRRAVAQ